MSDGDYKAREIDLGGTFGAVVVKANGAQVKISADAQVEIIAGSLHGILAPANDAAKTKSAPRIGDRDGGGVYVGKSATTGEDLHAALADEAEYLSFSEAIAAAEKMKKQPGRANAHVPTPEELDVNLYQNKDAGALKGTFNTSGSFPGSCYRSSAPNAIDNAWVQYFDDGDQNVLDGGRLYRLPLRLVW